MFTAPKFNRYGQHIVICDFICDLECSIPESEARNIIFECMKKSKIAER